MLGSDANAFATPAGRTGRHLQTRRDALPTAHHFAESRLSLIVIRRNLSCRPLSHPNIDKILGRNVVDGHV